MKKTSKTIFWYKRPVMIILCLLIIAGISVLGALKRNRDQMMFLKTKTIPEVVAKLIGDSTVRIKEISNIKLVSGIYSFDLNLESGGKVQKYTSYITKDGKLFFSSGMVVSDLIQRPEQAKEEKKATCGDLKKTNAPKITAFVVSNCPYGIQMQRLIGKTIEEQKDLASVLDVKYIGSVVDGKITSMHGNEEAQENLRQICIREEQKNLYWPYTSCYIKEGKSEQCLSETGVSVSALTSCMSDPNKGIAYAKKDFAITDEKGIRSSPTLLLNNEQTVSEFDFGGRVPDALREIACCAYTTKPGFCDTALTKDEVATSFSVLGTSTTAGGTDADCN